MFIINKLKKIKPFKVKQVNKRYAIELDTKNYIQYATETPIYDNLIVCDSEEPNYIKNPTNVQKCSFFDLCTRIKDEKLNHNTVYSYDELQLLYGSKRSKKSVKTKDQIEGPLNFENFKFEKFAGEEQFIPNFNEDAEKPNDIYKLSLMFDEQLIKQIKNYDVNVENLRVGGFTYKEKFKAHFIILDTILYILKRKYIPERLPHGNISYDILNDILTQKESTQYLEYNKVKNYNQHEKMKFITMAYIMMLKVQMNNLDLNQIPFFHLTDAEVRKIFRLLGCKIDGLDIKLKKVPELIIRRTYRRRG